MTFKDYFSKQAADCARFRPGYPRGLFAFLASIAPKKERALDCATGNGQAAAALAEFFCEVIGLDASANQIASAEPGDRVKYRVASAEATGLPPQSFDLITVAQALHWFDLDSFYAEARRLLRAKGVLACWAYNYLHISPEIDPIVRHYHDEVVGPFWPPERKLVGTPYLSLPFPFEEITTPSFQIEVQWGLDQLTGYLHTWSATQRFIAEKQRDPIDEILPFLKKAWGEKDERVCAWPLTLRVGRA